MVDTLAASYDQWWDDVQPLLVNEKAHETAPKVNPYRELYLKQFGESDAASAKKRKN